MPNEKEIPGPYNELGRLHNEGVEFVIGRIRSDDLTDFTPEVVMQYTAQFMFYLDCCDIDLTNLQRPRHQLSKIKYIYYFEFLTNLQKELKSKSISYYLRGSGINPELMTIVDMIFSEATDIEQEEPTKNKNNHELAIQMLNYLQRKNAVSSVNENTKRAIEILASIGKASIEHGMNVISDPETFGIYKRVNSNAHDTTQKEKAEKKKFRWSWKADAEGAVGGLISGGIGGLFGGLGGAAIGGLLGAVGGSISNSLIRSIPAFDNKE